MSDNSPCCGFGLIRLLYRYFANNWLITLIEWRFLDLMLFAAEEENKNARIGGRWHQR
jgi:hypothetical protein